MSKSSERGERREEREREKRRKHMTDVNGVGIDGTFSKLTDEEIFAFGKMQGQQQGRKMARQMAMQNGGIVPQQVAGCLPRR